MDITAVKIRQIPHSRVGEALETRLTSAIAKMPHQTIRDIDHKDGLGGWILKNGWVGGFFTSLFYHVMNQSGQEWYQPLLFQTGRPMNINGQPRFISGMTVCIKSRNGRTLMLLTNEPGAPVAHNQQGGEIHPVLRQLVQVGAQKWFEVFELHDEIKDRALAVTVGILGHSMFDDIDWSIAMHDPTRIKGETLIGRIVISDAQFDQLADATASLGSMVFSEEEIRILLYVGEYLTPHAVVALLQ